MEAHENVINFEAGRNINSVEFVAEDHVITADQPWGGVTCAHIDKTTRVGIVAGRHASKECAQWFSSYVDNKYDDMIHTMGGDNIPNQLNFAVKGRLSINGDSYEVCIGQGHHDDNNNWHIASTEILADGDAKNGTLGNKYRLEQDGTHGFKVNSSIS